MLRPEPVVLVGPRIRLEPLAGSHLPELQSAGDEDPSLFRFMASNPYLRGGWEPWLAEALEGQTIGRYVCWATIDRASGRAIGSTRFGDIEPGHCRIEIGWTWLAPSCQGTGVNTEAKLLQLQYAFDVLGAGRVAFRTDARNARSRRALERLGATQEGVLRRHTRMPDGFLRDTVYYSILSDEWPAIRSRLVARLTEPAT